MNSSNKQFLLLFICLFINLLGYTQITTDTCLYNSQLGISFPPVASQMQRDFGKLHLNKLGVKKIRFAEEWALREPSPGMFNWGALAKKLLWADSNNYEVLLTIQSNGPAWACAGAANAQSCVFNNSYFKNYTDSLLIHYGHLISKIQFGNEWQTDFWYAGSAKDYIQASNTLYQSVQQHAPSIEFVLGGFTTISLRVLAGCNGYVTSFYDDDANLYDSLLLDTACTQSIVTNVKGRIDSVLSQANYDFLDLHLYDDVEQWDEYYLNFIDTISSPIIVSEFGGPNMNLEPYTETYHANQVYKYIKKLDSLGITEIYFFKLVEGSANLAHVNSGLINDTTLNTKPAYDVFKTFMNCNYVSILTPTIFPSFSVYPNPNKGQINIDFGTSIEQLNIELLDLTGKIIFKTNKDAQQKKMSINTNELKGSYILKLTNNHGVVNSRLVTCLKK